MASGVSSGLGGIGTGIQSIFAVRGENAAYEIQKQAIANQVKYLKKNFDPEKMAETSLKYDKGFLQRRIDMQKEFDPELAQIRQLGKDQLLAQMKQDPSSLQSTRTANQLFKENITADPKMVALRGRLVDQATKNLDDGATLGPEFQAELLRSGLNTGSQAGIKADKRTIGGPVSRLLGSAGVQLQQQREDQSTKLAATAEALTQARANILGNIFPAVAMVESQNAQRAGAGFALGQATMPSAGLTGREVLGLDIGQKQGIMGLQMSKSDLRAQHKLAQARMWGNIAGTATSLGQMTSVIEPSTGQMVQQAAVAPGIGPESMLGGGGGGGGGGSSGGMDMGSIMSIIGMFSDANVKENVQSVDTTEVLAKLNALPVSSWNYIFDPGVRHVGPMAQDFNSMFGVGFGRTINPVDVFGVLLASIKALTREVESLKAQLAK